MSIFTKRNALIGYLTVKAISRKRRGIMPGGRKRNGWKLPVFVGLGVISAGVLAVLLALMLRRQREPEHIEGYVVADEPERSDPGEAEQREPREAA